MLVRTYAQFFKNQEFHSVIKFYFAKVLIMPAPLRQRDPFVFLRRGRRDLNTICLGARGDITIADTSFSFFSTALLNFLVLYMASNHFSYLWVSKTVLIPWRLRSKDSFIYAIRVSMLWAR